MSFLLSAKPRRRNQLPSRHPVLLRGRISAKDASSTSGGGQVQIPYTQRSHLRPHSKTMTQKHGLVKPCDQQKLETMQSAGVSMEQVMEDLRILEEQQHDSQRKLAQVKILKQNRLDRSSAVEERLNLLKYKNGENRAQLNRANEVLSLTTHEMEAVKLDASRSDDRLKAIDAKLKKALLVSRFHQAYRRKIDGRIISTRSSESVCHRHVAALRKDFKLVESSLLQNVDNDENLRKIIAELHTKANGLTDESCTIRSGISRLAEELRLSKHMEASTKRRAESIADEIKSLEKCNADEITTMMAHLDKFRNGKLILMTQQEQLCNELELQCSEIHVLWLRSIAIQSDEGHDASPEPVGDAPVPKIEVERILKTVQVLEQKLNDITATRNEKVASLELLKTEISEMDAEEATLAIESTKIEEIFKQSHVIELERTRRHEELISALVKQQGKVADLRSSLKELSTGLYVERERLDAEANDHSSKCEKKRTDLDHLKKVLALSKDSLNDIRAHFESQKCEENSKHESSTKRVENAKAAFTKVEALIKSFHDEGDLEFEQETTEFERLQEIMVEGTLGKIASLLKDNPKLQKLEHKVNQSKTPETRISDTLAILHEDCRKHKEEIRTRKKKAIAEIRRERRQNKRHSLVSAPLNGEIQKDQNGVHATKRRVPRDENSRAGAGLQGESVLGKTRDQDGMQITSNTRGKVLKKWAAAADIKRINVETPCNDKSLQARGETSGKMQWTDAVLPTVLAPASGDDASEAGRRRNFEETAITGVPRGRMLKWGRLGEAGRAASFCLGVDSSDAKLGHSFATKFEDEGYSDAEARGSFVGCLTQRAGLDFPTPKDEAQANRSEARRQKLNVHWESERKVPKDSLNLAKQHESTEDVKKLAFNNETKERHSRLKVFGSTPREKKERLQKGIKRTSSNSDIGKKPALVVSSKSQSDCSPMKTNADVESGGRRSQRSSPSSTHPSHCGPSPRWLHRSNPMLGKEKASSAMLVSNDVTSMVPLKASESCSVKTARLSKRSLDGDPSQASKKRTKTGAASILDRLNNSRGASPSIGRRDSTARSEKIQRIGTSTTSQNHTGSSYNVQISGISSGERSVSRSRRRKGIRGVVPSALTGAKSVLARVDDFSFNF